MALIKATLFSCAIGLALFVVSPAAGAGDMPLPPSVAKDMATGASPGPATAPSAKTKAGKRGKRGARAAKAKVEGGIETDKSSEENMSTGAESPASGPTLSPSGNPGLNFRF